MLKENLEKVFAQIKNGNNLGEKIDLVGATKMQSAEIINEAISYGLKIVAENKVINDSPNTLMPGVNTSISNRLTGMFACIVLRSNNKINGKPKPKPRLIGSRKISFAHLFAKVISLIPHPPLQ